MEHVIKGYHDEALKQGYSLPPDFKNFIFGLLAQDREERVPEHVKITKHFMEHANPLAAKLERLAEKTKECGISWPSNSKPDKWVAYYFRRAKTKHEGNLEYKEFTADTPLAAVEAAIEQLKGGK